MQREMTVTIMLAAPFRIYLQHHNTTTIKHQNTTWLAKGATI